jgi:hypothetical protein
MPHAAWEYISGGTGDEITMRLNRESYDRIRLMPTILNDVSHIDTSIELLGRRLTHPILLAPTAYHRLIHAEGELATAKGAGAANATMIVSTMATTAVEDIAKVATGPLWFQLYVQTDRGFTRSVVGEGTGGRMSGIDAYCRHACPGNSLSRDADEVRSAEGSGSRAPASIEPGWGTNVAGGNDLQSALRCESDVEGH